MRGFLSGVISGGIVGVLGLGVLSQLAPPPAKAPARPVAQEAANMDAAPAAAPAGAEAPAPSASPEPAVTSAPEPAAPVAEASAPPAVDENAAAAEEPAPAPPQTEAEAPAAPLPPAEPGPAPDLALAAPGAAPEAPPQPAPPQASAETDAEADAAPAAAELPPVPPLTPEEQAMLAPSPEAAAPEAPEPDAAEAETPPQADALPGELPAHSPLAPVPPETTAEDGAPAEPLLDRPQPGLGGEVAGVTTGRLPAIGIAPPAETATDASAQVEDPRPIARFAAPFENPAGKPLFTIILADDGKDGVDRATLAALPLPVTFAVDPSAPEAEKIAQAYRAAGKEVAMLATGLPKGATASDVQVTFGANAAALPQAVAVVDLPQNGFQNDRKLAADVVPVIKDQGRGLVTFDRGLNAADQVARREAVPAAVLFRQIDAGDESIPVMRRYLDRAAFKAAQDGQVAVFGTVAPETIAAILEWSVEGRGGSVALAPLTALLAAGE